MISRKISRDIVEGPKKSATIYYPNCRSNTQLRSFVSLMPVGAFSGGKNTQSEVTNTGNTMRESVRFSKIFLYLQPVFIFRLSLTRSIKRGWDPERFRTCDVISTHDLRLRIRRSLPPSISLFWGYITPPHHKWIGEARESLPEGVETTPLCIRNTVSIISR